MLSRVIFYSPFKVDPCPCHWPLAQPISRRNSSFIVRLRGWYFFCAPTLPAAQLEQFNIFNIRSSVLDFDCGNVVHNRHMLNEDEHTSTDHNKSTF